MTTFDTGYAELAASLGPIADALSRLRILVTGATGFIGGHVVELFLQAGAEVHAVARRPDRTTSLGTPVLWHLADLADAGATRAAVEASKPDQIIHLAGLVKGARDPELMLPMFSANVASTVNVLDAARSCGVSRVHLAGSLEDSTEPGGIETSPYALSKAAARLYGDHYRTKTALEVVNHQIFMVYGPAQLDETKLIPYVIRCLQAGQEPALSSGTRLVDWVYVSDVAEGIARSCVIEAPLVPIPLGTGSLVTIRSVVDQLITLSGTDVRPRFGSLDDRANEVERVADTETTRALLHWTPSVGLAEGLQAALDWYGAH